MALTRNGYMPRLIDGELPALLNSVGAVCVEGPARCGKTRAALHHADSTFDLSDPAGNFRNRHAAEIDADMALEGGTPHHIGEWQEVPMIWDAVRSSVDRTGQRGMYILTGSSTPVRDGFLHTGTGRMATIRMRTMSLYESGDSSGQASVGAMFRGEMKNAITGDVSLDRLIHLIVRGGWPEAVGGELGHYRDGKGNGIDAVVRMPDGRWGAFEIELGMNRVDEASERLLKLSGKFADNGRAPQFLCVIVGMSRFAYRREDGVYVVPITALAP